MVTFAVDEVQPVLDRMPTRTLGETLPGALVTAYDPQLAVIDHGPTHAVLGAVHVAFAEHRPLVLTPDAVWLTIAQGVAQHVRLNAEALRPRLVRHTGRITLTVDFVGAPSTEDDWAHVVRAFRERLGDLVGDGRARLFACDFSTTTPEAA